MKMRFNGGPWDGTELDAPFCPDAIDFKHLDMAFHPASNEPMSLIMESAERNHHRYVFHQPSIIEGVELQVGVNLERDPEPGEHLTDLVDDSLLVMQYRYASGEKLDWEK